MKKLLCLLLISLLVIPYIPAFSESVNGEEHEAFALLEALGIGVYEETGEITRGGFAAMVCRMRGYEAPLSDEIPERTFEEYMQTLNAFNIVNGYSDGDYRVNNLITYDEAYTILVRCLGVGGVAEENGGFPGGYMRKAYELELNKDIVSSGSSYVSSEDAFILCYNALFSEYLELSSSEGNEATYKVSSANLLESVFDVFRKDGILDGVDLTRLAGKNDVKPFFISVDGFEIERAEYNCYDLLGYRVRTYYKHTEGEETQLVLILKSGKNNEVSVDVSDISEIGESYLEYYPEGIENGVKKKRLSFDGFKYVLYNGVSTDKELNLSMLEGKNGTVKLIDNDGGSGYEVICVDVYEDYVVSKTDVSLKKLYDKINTSKSIVLDNTVDEPYTVIFDGEMNEIGIESVSEGSVVSVYESAEDAYQKYIRAVVSTDTVNGVISSEEGGFEKICMGDTFYELTGACLDEFEDKLTLGSNYKLYFNRAGKVAFIESVSAAGSLIGYLKKAKVSGSFDENKLMLRIAVLSGASYNFSTFEASEKLEIDNVSYNLSKNNETNKVMTALNQSSGIFFGNGIAADVVAQFITYRQDSDGKIISIDTVCSDNLGTRAMPEDDGKSGNELYLREGDNLSYRQSNSDNIAYFGTKIHCRKNTPVFNYPFPGSVDSYLDENNYFMGNAEGLFSQKGSCQGTLHAIYAGDKFRADYLGSEYSRTALGSIGTHDRIAAVDRVYETVSADGENVYGIDVVSRNQNISIKAKKDFLINGMTSDKDSSLKAKISPSELKHGDLVRYVTDKDGYLTGMDFYFRAENGIINPAYFKKLSYTSANRFNKAYVMKKYDDGFLMAIADSYEEAVAMDYEDYEYVTEYATEYIIYDETKGIKNRVSVSSEAELKSYEEAGADCSEIIVHQHDAIPFGIYIIKR